MKYSEEEKAKRRGAYYRRLEELDKYCHTCTMMSPERCDWCTIGRKKRALDNEYSDVTGWGNHELWKKGG